MVESQAGYTPIRLMRRNYDGVMEVFFKKKKIKNMRLLRVKPLRASISRCRELRVLFFPSESEKINGCFIERV